VIRIAIQNPIKEDLDGNGSKSKETYVGDIEGEAVSTGKPDKVGNFHRIIAVQIEP